MKYNTNIRNPIIELTMPEKNKVISHYIFIKYSFLIYL